MMMMMMMMMMIVAYEILQLFQYKSFSINCFDAELCTAVQILLTFSVTRTVVQLADQPTGGSGAAGEDDRRQIDDDTNDVWRIADDRKSWRTL